MVTIFWVMLILLALWFSYFLATDFKKHKDEPEDVSWLKTGLIGFTVNFLDTLGIGAFAPQTALLRATRQTRDKHIPGTLNVANTLPTLAEAILFIKIIEVDVLTLTVMLVAAVAGAVIGAGIVAKLPEKKIRFIMGVALLVTAGFMLGRQLEWIKPHGTVLELRGLKLVIAGTINFLLGALMTAGIGLYAPCMALVYAMGLPALAAFPIMMGSCAFLMPAASYKFVKAGAYNRKAAVGMAIPGVAGVLLAAFVFITLNIVIVQWIVIAIVLYTSITMLLAYFKKREE